jgi:hypothetical protein
MAIGLAPIGWVLFSPSQRSLRSLTVLGTSLVPLAPPLMLALPFPLSSKKRSRLLKLKIGIRPLDGHQLQPHPLLFYPPFLP